MAGLDISLRSQYGAVAQMRWRMLLNSLRTRRGSFEMGSRIITQTFFSLIGLGIGTGLGFAAWQIAAHDSLHYLAALLWPVFLVWQFVPITIASFQENTDLSMLLRFPVSFGSYMLFYILFGLFDVSSLVGGIALLGIFIGVSIAQPGLIPWLALTLALFALFNILLTRMVFAWIDRWLAQRKTREILGVTFLFLMLALQLLNPAFHQHRRQSRQISRATALRGIHVADKVQSLLPPGLAANAVSSVHASKPVAAAGDLLFLTLYAAACGSLLSVRLRAQYRGESLGEAPRQTEKIARAQSLPSVFEGSGPIAAVIEKEIRYLMRSGVMLYGFLAPLIMVFLFSGGPHAGSGPSFAGKFALPLGVAYSFLGLTRFIYNSLGAEGAGIQIYFLSPTPFRKVMLAKNTVHFIIFLMELAVVCLIIGYRTGLPGPQILAITFSWLLFAVPAQLAIGNVISISMAYRMNMTRMSREQGAAGNGFLSLLVQLLVFAVGAAVYFSLARSGHQAFVAPVLLVLAAAAVVFWLRVLAASESMVQKRRESLIAALYKTA